MTKEKVMTGRRQNTGAKVGLASTPGNKFECRWIFDAKGAAAGCNEIFSTSDDLFSHVVEHVTPGPKGYHCKWTQCIKQRDGVYATLHSVKEHIRRDHVFAQPEADDKKSDSEIESAQDSPTPDSTCSDDDEDFDASKEIRQSKKRKRPNPPSKHAKIPKTVPAVVPTNTFERLDTVSRITSSLFYKFHCEWNVHSFSYGSDPSKIKCKRKFFSAAEATDHLVTHHATKLINSGAVLRCCWEKCAHGETEFADEEELKQHIAQHAQEGSRTTLPDTAPSVPSSSSAPKPTPVSDPAPVNKAKKKSGITWYTAPLHALLLCDVQPVHGGQKCGGTCYSCRFHEMKNKLENPSKSEIAKEFGDVIGKFEGYKDNAFKFLSCFVALAVEHEEANHDSDALKNAFWVDDVRNADLTCKKHTDKSLISVFPTLYKNCKICTHNSTGWPGPKRRNLIIALDRSSRTHIDEIIFVKGREYQLRTVLCVGAKTGNYYLHSYDTDEEWATYRGDSLVMTKPGKVLKDKGAIAVFYVSNEKAEVSSDCDLSVSGATVMVKDPVDTIETKPSVEMKPSVEIKPSVEPLSNGHFPPPDLLQDEDYGICDRSGGDFDPQFASRKLKNFNGVTSCINAALQALLTTTLSTIRKKICQLKANCCLCHVLSVAQRVYHYRVEKVVDPYELELNKGRLGVPETSEGNPVDYLKRLIGMLVGDEELHHSSSEAKYKFMIRFQKSCVCTESCEAYHWAVKPTKPGESLYDLMMDHTQRCLQCGHVADSQPVQMPENLIITVESSLLESRLRYPEELPTRHGRYFLSAVVVAAGSPLHYSAYCRAFGLWMHYDDEDARKVSCGDVIYQGEEVCLLVYVTKEVTAGDIRVALDKAKELNLTKAHVKVKEERYT